jgi:DNA gyrase subunit A
MKSFMIKQLGDIKKKYGKPRKTEVISQDSVKEFNKEIMIEDYQAWLFFTKDGYLKKITQQSLRGNSEQKIKENDEIIYEAEISNKDEVIFFTDKAQLYFAKMSDFDLCKASELGEYVPKKLNFDDDEHVAYMHINPSFDEKQNVIFFFENGKAVRVPMSQYQTQGSRKKLKKAFSDASKVVKIIYETNDEYIMLINSENKAILIRPSLIPIKTTRSSIGTVVFAMNLKKNQKIKKVLTDYEKKYPEAKESYRKIKIPATGVLISKKKPKDPQMKIDI